MAGIQDFAIWEDDFIGGRTFAATVGEGDWKITDTSASGTPTYAAVTPSATGEVALTMSSTSEVQNVCMDFGDVLSFDIDNLQRFEARVKVSGAMTSGSTLAFGLQSARNDNTDSTTNNAQFKMVGADSTTLVVVETDDGTTDLDDKATGVTLATTYKKFVIDFTGGKANVKFYIDGVRVAGATTFDMSAATSSLQPFVQIQKTATTNVNAVTVDYVKVVCKR
jgi:hypothetical protein